VYVIVGSLLLLLLATAGTTSVVRLRVTTIGSRLTDTLRPAQVAAAGLTKAYVDEETGERGFLLTRDSTFLTPYRTGMTDAARYRKQLGGLFTDDPTTAEMLSEVDAAATGWQTQATDPELAAFKAGTLTGPALAASVTRGRMLFDALRVRLAALQDRVNELVGVALQSSGAAQRIANEVTIAAALAALLLAGIAIQQLRASFARPLRQLVDQVQRVSGGDLDHAVDASGPLEIAGVGRTVEAMRLRIIEESVRSAATARQLARYEEAERIAYNLGDTVLRQLFTTSLGLQSTASRHPAVAPALATAINDIDQALRELQAAIFGLAPAPDRQPLGRQVLDLVDQLEVGLGVSPEVHLAGDLDGDRLLPVAADVVAVVREVTGSVIRSAGVAGSSISLSTADDALLLLITADSSPDSLAGDSLTAVRARAERHGGSCTVRRGPDTVTIDWRVPIPAPSEIA
jgi:CHASE3 domain sensor protein